MREYVEDVKRWEKIFPAEYRGGGLSISNLARDYLELVADRDALRAKLERAEAFIRDLADAGVRHDLTPSRCMKKDETGAEATLFFYEYMKNIDTSIRERARRELDDKPRAANVMEAE